MWKVPSEHIHQQIGEYCSMSINCYFFWNNQAVFYCFFLQIYLAVFCCFFFPIYRAFLYLYFFYWSGWTVFLCFCITFRDALIASVLDGVRASGNRDVHVKMMFTRRGYRLGKHRHLFLYSWIHLYLDHMVIYWHYKESRSSD